MYYKMIGLFLMASLIIVGCQQEQVSTDEEQVTQTENEDQSEPEESESESEEPIDDNEDLEEDDSDNKVEEKEEQVIDGEKDESGLVIVNNPESIKVLVNKQRKLPEGYKPSDLVVPDVPFYFEEFMEKKQMREEAAHALEDLFEAAETDQVELIAASGYRSYQTQKMLYENYVEEDGQKAADRYSARPGTSEHQTGLTIDLTSAEMAFKLEQTFKETSGGSWLADNAHQFGFIIRYPEGKEEITGYMYEPWHIRYVGKDIAKEIYEQDITLEEYFGYGY